MNKYWIIGNPDNLHCVVIESDKEPENSLPYKDEVFSKAKFDKFPNPTKVEQMEDYIEVPQEVPLWAFRLVLKLQGLENIIESKLNELEEPTKTVALYIWNKGNFIERQSPMLNNLAIELELTDKQVDLIFIEANKIKL